jgi:hypothetical protein
MVFELPGAYQVIVAKAGVGGLSGELDHDLATLELSGKSYVRLRRKFSVR